MTPSRDIAVFIDPISPHYREDRLFSKHANLGHYHEPYGLVRDVFAANGIPVHTADLLLRGEDVRGTNVYFAIANLANLERVAARDDVLLSALFHTEAPIVQPSVYRRTPEVSTRFRRIFSFSTAAALEPYGCGAVSLTRSLIPEPQNAVIDELWARADRQFMTIVMHNRLPVRKDNELYTERLRAIAFFAGHDEIDLYGLGWETVPFRVGERRVRLPGTAIRASRYVRSRTPILRRHPHERVIRKVYRGAVESKYEALSRYTFSLTYENMVLDGWINEKLFDAMLAGTVPVYLGAPDITDWVPEECFIDQRRFSGYPELRDYLHSLGPGEVASYRENARDFLASERFKPFSKETFARQFLSSVESDLGLELADDGLGRGGPA